MSIKFGGGILSASDDTVPRKRWVVLAVSKEHIIDMLTTLEDNGYQHVAVLTTKFANSVLWQMSDDFFAYHLFYNK